MKAAIPTTASEVAILQRQMCQFTDVHIRRHADSIGKRSPQNQTQEQAFVFESVLRATPRQPTCQMQTNSTDCAHCTTAEQTIQ
ncbi:hypothetical protein HYALB_00009372 [Hymenoscyphus albidus]|uniref:Uncharacterized protein n=1 Tax=Hymenoscyphus albidus TaxID=595503 RepID=A0A9N9LG13_9HELO|nr:hypothetical protein HYALB_00009372 [Hymenoscyphus albidus]